MAKEIKTDTTKEEEPVDAEATEEETTEVENSEEEADATKIDDKIDYKAIADRETEKRIAAEKATADLAFKLRDKKRKVEDVVEDVEEDDDDKPVTKKDLSRIISETTQQTEKRLMGGRIKDIANDLADSTDEAAAIIATHANRTFPSHLSLEEQLEEAHAIVNRKKLVSTNSELKRALKSKGTVSRDGAGTHRDSIESPAPKLSVGDTAAYKRAGFTFDTKDKLWKKKLPTGKTLIKDPKSKQTYLAS